MEISELFYSIQGESTFAGQPCLFIRLSGCNLRCNYCDAHYTYEEPGRKMQISELLDFVKNHTVPLVEITGGEPLMQPEVNQLMVSLLAEGRTVLLETNGSISLAKVPAGVIKIMDIKCPDSGMHEHLAPDNPALLNKDDEIKFVLSSRKDYDWAKEIIRTHKLNRLKNLHFSPVVDRLPPATLADWIMADQLPVRIQLQLHTILWPELKRGV
ncbi:MAG: radical SAM protein [Proteobacteria bacterium]|nr:radical SAM protein [Pseudomonadota bacterium]MBU1716780.1 radical SAM protein [Pseudomonadota bacterium]